MGVDIPLTLATVGFIAWLLVAVIAIPRLGHANGQSRIIRAAVGSSVFGLLLSATLLYNALRLPAAQQVSWAVVGVRLCVIGMACVKLWLVQAWKR